MSTPARRANVGPLTPAGRETWEAIAELAHVVPSEQWAIVGGQMVAIHAAVAGVEPPRTTDDGDIVVDVRTHGRHAMQRVAGALTAARFPTTMSPEGVTRFERERAKIDLLAPEGIGDHVETGRAEAAPPDLPDRGLHPDLVDIDQWLQTDITSLEELEGQVVVVQFWTFDCSNWLATLDHMQQLYANYHDQGFEIVAIHSPEFDYEADVDNVVAAAERHGVTWPIAVDTNKRTFHAWQEGSTAYWPRIYLLDRSGHIRYDHIGEGRYDEIDAAVRALLAEPA